MVSSTIAAQDKQQERRMAVALDIQWFLFRGGSSANFQLLERGTTTLHRKQIVRYSESPVSFQKGEDDKKVPCIFCGTVCDVEQVHENSRSTVAIGKPALLRTYFQGLRNVSQVARFNPDYPLVFEFSL